MRIITDVEEMAGKTIKRVEFFSDLCRFGIVFVPEDVDESGREGCDYGTDDECAIVSLVYRNESYYLVLDKVLSTGGQRDIGLISEEQYAMVQALRSKERDRICQKRELEQLATLKIKYEGGES